MRWLRFALIIGAVAIFILIAINIAFFVIPVESGTQTSPRVIETTPRVTAQTIAISFGPSGTLQAEIANTINEREVGLMNRSSLGADAGMLFVFPSDTSSAFWMKDTLIPLSIAFVKADGTIVHIEDMQPQTETLHYSTEPYRYAIEANVGWFAGRGIHTGNKAEIRSGISATS